MSDQFVPTDSILDKILAHKVEELAQRKSRSPLNVLREMSQRVSPPYNFAAALRREAVALIAEIKKASPSQGVLLEDFDHRALATTYARNGAAAISVLTDEQFFQGHLSYLEEVHQTVATPTLRKDFIIDEYQIYEARIARADAVLLIVAALTDAQLQSLHDRTTALSMAALVEVHNETELERALKIGATLIGINNRDLKTFEVDLGTTARLAPLVPDDVTLVAESGIKSAQDVAQMGVLGAHAVLVGEALVKATDVAQTVREFSSQKRA